MIFRWNSDGITMVFASIPHLEIGMGMTMGTTIWRGIGRENAMILYILKWYNDTEEYDIHEMLGAH